MVGCREIEHVAAAIFVGSRGGGFSEFARAVAIDPRRGGGRDDQAQRYWTHFGPDRAVLH